MVPSEIILPQETKIKEEALFLLSKNKWRFTLGKVVSARGTYGGLATLWCAKSFQLLYFHATEHWIFTELFHSASKISIALFNLYVPVNYVEKQECWRTLSNVLESLSPIKIILAGDLNISLAPNAKKRWSEKQGFYARYN